MPAIHIRDIPEQTLLALKERAAANHRSLQMELRHALIELAQAHVESNHLPELDLRMSEASSGQWNREQIYGDDGR